MRIFVLLLALTLSSGCSCLGSSGSSGSTESAGGGGATPPTAPAAPPGPPIELLATVGTRPVEYGGTSYAAENMLDNVASSYWCSNMGPTFPIAFTVEVPVEAEITSVVFDTVVNGYGTAAPKDVTIEVAPASAPTTFAAAATAVVAQNAVTPVNLPTPMRAKTVRVTIQNNHGGTSCVIAELRLMGRGGTPRPSAAVAAAATAAAAVTNSPVLAALRGLPEAPGYMALLTSVGMDADLATSTGMTFLVPTDAAVAAAPADLRADRARLRNALAGMMLMGTLSRVSAPGNPSWGALDQARTNRAVALEGTVMTIAGATSVREVEAGGCVIQVINQFLLPGAFDATQGRNPFGVNIWALPQ